MLVQDGPKKQKEGQHSMNRDEESYILSHSYDRFLVITTVARTDRRHEQLSSDEGF